MHRVDRDTAALEELSELVVPETSLARIALEARAVDEAPVSLEGSLEGGIFRAEIATDRLPLPPGRRSSR